MVPLFLLRGFWDELDKRGVAPAELERLSGVGRPRAGDCATLIAASDMYRLFEVSQRLSGDPVIGLTAGRALGTSGFHLVGHLVLASATLTQAIELVVRVLPRLRSRLPVVEELADGRMRIGFIRRDGETGPGARAEAELTGVLLHDIAVSFFEEGASQRPLVEFPFATPRDPQPYRRMFPGGVRFGGAGTFVYIARAALAQRRSGTDADLLDQLLQLAQEQYRATNLTEDWTSRVRAALRAQSTPRMIDTRVLAGQLGVSVRGLARRLAREGSSLTALLDEALYERAQLLLRRPDATAAQVADALGYAELSSFFRAFRRWSGGLTPAAYRRSSSTAA